MAERFIDVEVACATPSKQLIIGLAIAEGSTVRQAVEKSGIRSHFPEVDIQSAETGVFGEIKTPDYELQAGDRVEIYRPLIFDPKEQRRRRAAKSSS